MASTPHPTDDREIDRGAGLPSGLRPIEVGELAAQQLDSAAGDHMAEPGRANEGGSMPPLAVEEGGPSDVDRIGLQHLDARAEDFPEVPAPATPKEGGVDQALPTWRHPIDAEPIASERPEGATEDWPRASAS